MGNLEYIKSSFDQAMRERGYRSEWLPASSAGHHSIHFERVVNGAWLFYPRLILTPDVVYRTKHLSFLILIDLQFEHEQRDGGFAWQGCDIKPFGGFSFGIISDIAALAPELASKFGTSPGFDGFANWNIGKGMPAARALVGAALPLLMDMLDRLEQKFEYPGPLQNLSIDELYAVRAASKGQSHHWQGLPLSAGEHAVRMYMSYFKKLGKMDMVTELEEFLKVAP